MSTLHVSLGARATVFYDDEGGTFEVPLGSDGLAGMIAGDPPLPEELTNAICLFMDHLEDVTREVPTAAFADRIAIHGPGLQALVDTQAGLRQGLPADLSRPAVEEVFRTLATEAEADRLCNPGLPAQEVHHVLGVACALVATLRALQAAALTIDGDEAGS